MTWRGREGEKPSRKKRGRGKREVEYRKTGSRYRFLVTHVGGCKNLRRTKPRERMEGGRKLGVKRVQVGFPDFFEYRCLKERVTTGERHNKQKIINYQKRKKSQVFRSGEKKKTDATQRRKGKQGK